MVRTVVLIILKFMNLRGKIVWVLGGLHIWQYRTPIDHHTNNKSKHKSRKTQSWLIKTFKPRSKLAKRTLPPVKARNERRQKWYKPSAQVNNINMYPDTSDANRLSKKRAHYHMRLTEDVLNKFCGSINVIAITTEYPITPCEYHQGPQIVYLHDK